MRYKECLREADPYPGSQNCYMPADGKDEVRSGAGLLRVFLLEDEPAVANGLAALLEQEGHEVRIAESIAMATSEVAGFVPDVIVADIALPDGNGIEFCRRLRERGFVYPTVFISGHADSRSIVELKWPSADFLRKPFDFQDLLASIERVVRKGRLLRR